MIVNDDSRVINKLEASLTDNARVVICDCHMFIVQATELKHGTKIIKNESFLLNLSFLFKWSSNVKTIINKAILNTGCYSNQIKSA